MSNDTRFVGPIPELYDRHLGPCLFEPYARDLAMRVPHAARRILEIAAGTGRVTRHLLSNLVADGELLATDLNEPMLAVAQKHVGTDPRLTWKTADAQALPVADDSIDAVVCQFGLMFVPDQALAMREIKRVLVPGGILLLSVWDDLANNPASKLLHELAFKASPDDPPVFMKVPFALTGHDLERLATEARFLGIRVDTVKQTGEAESAAHLAHGFVRGNPLWNQLVDRGVDAAGLEAEVASALAHSFGDKPCRTPLSAHVLTAFA